jgi:hypothetical protein
MKKNAKKKLPNGRDARPAFTLIDWIVAAFSIALLVYILVNLPPV